MSRKSVLHQKHSSGLGGGEESALGLLLEQALRIKEEVAASLQSTQGSIQALDGHVTHRDSVASATSTAVQNLDQKSTAGIGDLRGRVARCDASIARLSADVISGGQQVRRLQQEVTELRSTLDVQLKIMETKLCQAMDKVETSLSEKVRLQRTSMYDLHSQVKLMETRHSGGLEEAKGNTARLRRWIEDQLQASLQTHTQEHTELQSLLQDKLLDAESKSKEHLRVLEARLDRVEVQQEQLHHHMQADQQKGPESKLEGRMRSLENSLQKELRQHKQETHKGFKYVHDAIEILRQIGHSKSGHGKDKLRQDKPTGIGPREED
ncbi:hypothetical protein NHX12_028985 [Muraenolepis orangiensis]|uniref:Uncharacterized protein n=1 Tax=Muraenolepis orangiensis TaxID=630683 RepID=A0A9Q0ECU5_9TELE|nr:hypothetical protein NHX12_028985 [Muraenolepis orangiensis]